MTDTTKLSDDALDEAVAIALHGYIWWRYRDVKESQWKGAWIYTLGPADDAWAKEKFHGWQAHERAKSSPSAKALKSILGGSWPSYSGNMREAMELVPLMEKWCLEVAEWDQSETYYPYELHKCNGKAAYFSLERAFIGDAWTWYASIRGDVDYEGSSARISAVNEKASRAIVELFLLAYAAWKPAHEAREKIGVPQ